MPDRSFAMDKADDTSNVGDRYAKRLLDRSHYSDCYSQSYRRRLSVMEALSKSSVIPSSDQRYNGNPFEKEFSGANKDTSDDQLEVTYVSTWPEDNADQTYGIEPRDSLFCAKSLGGEATRRPTATTEYRSFEQFCRDILDTDGESSDADATSNSRPTSSHEPKLSIGERFGPLTSNELTMQSTLNLKFDMEFEQCNARMQLQGADEFFGARVIEICEPTIIKFHRKSCDSETVGTQTRENELVAMDRDDSVGGWIETDLDAPSSSIPEDNVAQLYATDLTYVKADKGKTTDSNEERASLSLGSDDLRELDFEIDKLQLEQHDESSDKVTSQERKNSSKVEIVGAKLKNTVDGANGRPLNYSSMENFDDIRMNPTSPKNATFSITPNNSPRQQANLSKTASFLKRHTSFLFKNLRTPKLVRRKSSAAESTAKKTNVSPWTRACASALTRSSTMGSSDYEKPTTMFQKQVQQVQADLPPDVDDTMGSEMESFLKVALGNGKYNSTMAHADSDSRHRTYSLLSNNNADYCDGKNARTTRKSKSELTKHSSTLNRTMTIYKTFTQRIRDKFRKYEPDDSSFDIVSNLEPQNILPDGLDSDTRKIVQQLQDKVNVQNTLIHQTSKALQLCDSMPEFTVSPERIEYERLLLLAILTKNVILREIDLLIDQRARNNNRAYTHTERGEVTLKDIRLQLREDVLRRERQNGDIVEWFVVVVIQGVTVWATHAIACPIASPQIYFPGVHVVSGLTPDFRLSIKVYSMKLQQLKLYNHDDKYHITRSYTFGGGNKIKTPKMMRRRKSSSPKQRQVKYTGVAKDTSFVYCGGLDLMLYDLKLPSPWPLNSQSPNSVLHGTVDLNFSCKLELSMFHAGFLTHCEETGDLAWNRRWCLLEGHKLLFWNYPREQEYNPPIYVIDLVNCISSRIDPVDRRLCPRQRTLLIETKGNEKSCIVVEDGYNRAVTRHLLSFDNQNELSEWDKKLNQVVSALSDWNIIQTD